MRACQTRACPKHRFMLDFTYTPKPYRRKSTVSGLTLYFSAVSLKNTTMRTWLWLRVGCYPFMAAYPTASAVWSPYYGKHQTLNSAAAPKTAAGLSFGPENIAYFITNALYPAETLTILLNEGLTGSAAVSRVAWKGPRFGRRPARLRRDGLAGCSVLRSETCSGSATSRSRWATWARCAKARPTGTALPAS